MDLRNRKKSFLIAWIIFYLCGYISQAMENIPSSQTVKVCKKWDLPLHDNLAYLSISNDGGLVLASTRNHKLSLIDSNKKVLWTKKFNEPIKAQALSPEGNLIALTTYDDKLQVLDIHGHKLWERSHLGRPLIFPQSNYILLLNDDDSEPQTAFVTYDYKGTLQATVTVQSSSGREPLDTFAFSDEKAVLVSISGGGLAVFDLTGHLIAQGQSRGETIAAATKVMGEQRELYVLSSEKKQQYLAAFTLGNEKMLTKLWEITLTGSYEALQVLHDTVILYGNSDQGQILTAHDIFTGMALWQKGSPITANYSSLFFKHESPDYVTFAIDTGKQPGILNLRGITTEGNILWDLPLRAPNGIYSYALSQNPVNAVVGIGDTENNVIQYYEVGCKGEK